MDKRVENFLQKFNLTDSSKYLAEIEFESLLLLQPQHTKELIPNINARIKFDSIFFKNVELEREINCERLDTQSVDSSETYSYVNVDVNADVNVDHVEIIEKEPVNGPIDQNVQHIEDFPVHQNAESIECIELTDAFGIMNINDLDYDIILGKYRKVKTLSAGDRITLSHCILKYILKDDVKREILTSEFENLAATIAFIFPPETKQTFFIPGYKGASARGKLYQAYKSFREQLSAADMITRRKRKRNSHPWEQIVLYWSKTVAERDIILKENPAETYLERFPCLGLASGFELLQDDFRRKFPAAKAAIEWDRFVSRALLHGASCHDKTARKLLRESPPKTKSDEIVMALKLLPFLLPGPRSRATKANPRLNKLEVSKKFISHFKTQGDDDLEVTEFISLKVVGSEKHIAYVQLGTFKYPFENIFDALSCCVQLYFTLDVKYAKGTAHIWDFLNVAFFNIDTKNVAPFAFTLLTDLIGIAE